MLKHEAEMDRGAVGRSFCLTPKDRYRHLKYDNAIAAVSMGLFIRINFSNNLDRSLTFQI